MLRSKDIVGKPDMDILVKQDKPTSYLAPYKPLHELLNEIMLDVAERVNEHHVRVAESLYRDISMGSNGVLFKACVDLHKRLSPDSGLKWLLYIFEAALAYITPENCIRLRFGDEEYVKEIRSNTYLIPSIPSTLSNAIVPDVVVPYIRFYLNHSIRFTDVDRMLFDEARHNPVSLHNASFNIGVGVIPIAVGMMEGNTFGAYSGLNWNRGDASYDGIPLQHDNRIVADYPHFLGKIVPDKVRVLSNEIGINNLTQMNFRNAVTENRSSFDESPTFISDSHYSDAIKELFDISRTANDEILQMTDGGVPNPVARKFDMSDMLYNISPLNRYIGTSSQTHYLSAIMYKDGFKFSDGKSFGLKTHTMSVDDSVWSIGKGNMCIPIQKSIVGHNTPLFVNAGRFISANEEPFAEILRALSKVLDGGIKRWIVENVRFTEESCKPDATPFIYLLDRIYGINTQKLGYLDFAGFACLTACMIEGGMPSITTSGAHLTTRSNITLGVNLS